MAIYKMDVEFRYPYLATASGWYYWTNVFYFEAFSTLEWVEKRDLTTDAIFGTIVDTVQRGTWKVTNLNTGILVDQLHSFHNAGSVVLPHTPVTLTNCAYVRGHYADGSRFYKRIRFPLWPEAMQSTGKLADDFFATWEPYFRHWGEDGIWCNSSGSPLVDTELSPYTHMWQLRDGTKRRSRDVLYHP